MSESESTPQPRRSQRDRKVVERLGQDSPLKRKRGQGNEDDALSDVSDPNDQDVQINDVDEDDELEYKASSKPAKQGRKRASPVKPRAAAPKKPRARKQKGEIDVAKMSKETHISDDNALFNAILNPATALQGTVEDFLESFKNDPAAALADLMTCVLRCCGCNNTLNPDQVMDLDGIVDALDTITEELRLEDSPVYPLNSKFPVFKTFRKSLSEFLSRLVQSSDDTGILHDSDIITTLQAWVIAMSSSVLRSFRHTATAIALETQTALCQIAAATDAEVEMIQRQRQGERKKKGKGGTSGREKDLEKKAKEVNTKRSQITEYIKEFFDGVFIHRYRDLDPAIRADCVQALGKWIITHSTYFLDGSYLRYIGWVLSDPVNSVRLASVKALAILYAKRDYAVSLSHFTDRFKKRMVEIACRDTDLSIRVATIGLLSNIEQLEDDERDKVCLLVFDGEAKVRKAVSGFVKGVWEEAFEDKMVGLGSNEVTRQRVGIKCLASLLVKWTQILDSGDDNESQSQSQADAWQRPKEVGWLVSGSPNETRVAMVVDALADEVDAVSEWQPLLDNLLLDHSATEETPARKSKKGKAAKAPSSASDDSVDDAWRLDEVEEGIMLEVFVAALAKLCSSSGSGPGKKAKDKDATDASTSEITRALIKSLPRLISKHQTDEGRISEILLIPQMMNLDMYLEMRVVPAYESLWDSITQQFMTHSSTATLVHAASTMNHMLAASTLSSTNATKTQELDDGLAAALRDTVSGHDGLEISTFSQDETQSLASVCSRIAILVKTRDMTLWMEDDDDGKQSAAWDIFTSLLERATLGYQEEEKMTVDVLDILALHIIWKFSNMSTQQTAADEAAKENLRTQRDWLLERMVEYTSGGDSTVCEEVRKTAFQHALSLYSLFRPVKGHPDDPSIPGNDLECEMPDETQYRFAGFVQSQLERYAEVLAEMREPASRQTSPALSEDEDFTQTQRSSKKRKEVSHQIMNERSLLAREYEINSFVSCFIRAIRARVVAVRHSGIILAHFGRLDAIFDTCAKTIIDVLKEEGMLNANGEVVVSVGVQAVRESFNIFLGDKEEDDSHTIAFARVFSSCFVMRGSQLAIVRRLESKYLVRLQTTLISWIVPKIAGYHVAGDTKLRAKSLVFFRSLSPLLTHLDSRDALQVKAHLDQALATAKLEIGTAKAWDPFHSYIKKLTPGASKAKGTKCKKKAIAPNGEAVTDDEGATSQSENEEVQPPPSQRRTTRPKPRPAFREPTEEQEEDEFGIPEPTDAQITPRASRVIKTFGKTPQRPPLSDRNGSQQAVDAGIGNSPTAEEETLASPTKRKVAAVVDSDVPNFKSRRKRIKL